MLTNNQIKSVESRQRPFKLTDGEGLHLLVKPNGKRWWRFRYRFEGREKLLSLGQYPYVSLQQARLKRNDARKLLCESIDPGARRVAARQSLENTFERVAREWLALQKDKFEPTTYNKAVWVFETLTFPAIGKRPIDRIAALDVLRLLRRIESPSIRRSAARHGCTPLESW